MSNLPQRSTERPRIHFTTSSDESSSSSDEDGPSITSTDNIKSNRRPRTSSEEKIVPTTINRAAPKKQSSPQPRPSGDEDEDAPSTISWTRLETPTKSTIDKNEYRLIRLKNGLKALIISCDEVNNVDPPWLTVYPESQAEPSGYANNPFKSFSLYSKSMSSDMYSFIPSTSKEDMNLNNKSWTPESLLPSLFPSCVDGDGEHKKNNKDQRPPPTCCVSLMVNVGSHDDPKDFPGIAHLCEHLVHHGSKNFPTEEGYHRSVQSLGGRTNAFTDKEKTNYHFSVMQRDEYFAGPSHVMKMLADLLAYPLFPLDSVQREIESVDNEFFMRKTSLHFRRDYLLNQLLVEDENHPLRTFSIGNKDKLMPNHVHNSPIKLQNALKDFHRKHYSAENMNLVVQASVPIQILEAQVAAIFENIPSNISKTQESCSIRKSSNNTTKRCSSAKTPYDNKNFNKMVTIIPNEEENQLTIMWALPPEAAQNYKTKPLDYIGALLSDSSPNGLEACLRKENLILKLYSGNSKSGCLRNKYVSLFVIEAKLTTKGRDEIEKVLEIIFSYLQLIKEEGVDKKLYTQLDALEQIHFKYFPPSTSLQNTVQLSDNMRWCPNTDILYGSQRFFEFDKKQINKWLNQLIPSKALFSLVTNLVGEVRLEHEELYGTRYIVQEVPKTLLRTLEKISPDKYYKFELPNWSQSIPGAVKFNKNIIDLAEPEFLIDVPCLVVGYKPSPGLTSPQVGLALVLATPWDLEPCVDCGITDIWSTFLTLSIDADAHSWYDMGVDINIHFLQNKHRLYLFINGLNYKLEQLLDIVLNNILKLSQMATEEKFDIYKEFISNCYENPNLDSTRLSHDLLNRLKHSNHATGFEKSEKTRSLTFGQFQRFANLLTSCVKIELVVTGNASKQDALQIGNYILNKKYFGEILSQEVSPVPIKKSQSKVAIKKVFPLGERCLRTKAINKDSRISTVHNYYVLSGRGEENELICGLFFRLINELLFHQLRTIQQLGYDVSCNLPKDQQHFGLSIVVANHADKFCPCDVDLRIDQFLQNIYTCLEKSNYITAVFIRDNKIHRSHEYLLNYYTKYFLKHGSDFRKISVQVLACCGGTAENACMDFTEFCKRSNWESKNSSIPKLTFATDLVKNSDSSNGSSNKDKTKQRRRNNLYFISNIQQFHK